MMAVPEGLFAGLRLIHCTCTFTLTSVDKCLTQAPSALMHMMCDASLEQRGPWEDVVQQRLLQRVCTGEDDDEALQAWEDDDCAGRQSIVGTRGERVATGRYVMRRSKSVNNMCRGSLKCCIKTLAKPSVA